MVDDKNKKEKKGKELSQSEKGDRRIRIEKSKVRRNT